MRRAFICAALVAASATGAAAQVPNVQDAMGARCAILLLARFDSPLLSPTARTFYTGLVEGVTIGPIQEAEFWDTYIALCDDRPRERVASTLANTVRELNAPAPAAE